MQKVAIFPGSFDPFTIGHESVVRRGLNIFDSIVIAIGYNINKPGFYSIDQRKLMIESVFNNDLHITVVTYDTLTVDLCKKLNANYLLRGVRSNSDFEYESSIAHLNRMLFPGLETVFLLTLPEHSPISSTMVRDILKHGGDVTNFIPKGMELIVHK